MFIAEPRISGDKAEDIIRRVKMQCIQKVEVEGMSGGLWMLSKNNNYKIDIICIVFTLSIWPLAIMASLQCYV